MEPVFFDYETSPTDAGDVIPATLSFCRVTTNLQCGFSFCLLGYLYLTEIFIMFKVLFISCLPLYFERLIS